MKNIPVRIKAFFSKNNIKCNKCKHIFSIDDLKAISIRNSFINKKKEVLSVEVFCPECKNITFFELVEMNLIDFSFEVLSEIENKEIPEKRKNKLENNFNEEDDFDEEFDEDDEDFDEEDDEDDEDFDEDEPFSSFKKGNQSKNKNNNNKQKSKITLKEIKENIENLNKIDSHSDFLENLGFSPDNIKE